MGWGEGGGHLGRDLSLATRLGDSLPQNYVIYADICQTFPHATDGNQYWMPMASRVIFLNKYSNHHSYVEVNRCLCYNNLHTLHRYQAMFTYVLHGFSVMNYEKFYLPAPLLSEKYFQMFAWGGLSLPAPFITSFAGNLHSLDNKLRCLQLLFFWFSTWLKSGSECHTLPRGQ